MHWAHNLIVLGSRQAAALLLVPRLQMLKQTQTRQLRLLFEVAHEADRFLVEVVLWLTLLLLRILLSQVNNVISHNELLLKVLF